MLFRSTQKEVQQKSENVIRKENINKEQQKFDAKEKGSNEYVSVKVKKKVKQEEDGIDEKVLVKSQGGFDIKI